MKALKIFCAMGFCFWISEVSALDTKGMEIIKSEVQVCRDHRYNRFDVRLWLKNTTKEKINFGANTSSDGGLSFYPPQIKAKFCHADGECNGMGVELASYDGYNLDTFVRPRGVFLYADSVIIKPRKNSSELKGIFHFQLKGSHTTRDGHWETSFETTMQQAVDIESIPKCSNLSGKWFSYEKSVEAEP